MGRPSLPLYVDALRHARPAQLLGRLRRAIPPAVLAPRRGDAHPRWEAGAADLAPDPAPQGGRARPEETGVFAAYGARRAFGDPGFWDDPADGLLFGFHLHGFADLASYAAGAATPEGDAFWARVVESWLTTQRRPRRPAWHPYPTSLRVIAWSAAISALPGWPEELKARVAGELRRQARYLARTVEHDIGGNHVLKNATALAHAGAVLPDSGFLDTALRLLEREIPGQILADGGHEERSTSYHREVAHDLATVAELARRRGDGPPPFLTEAMSRAQAWQAAMAGPDMSLPLLNDAWEGPPLADRRDEPLTHLADSGYVVMRHGADQATWDVGRMCPAHLPAHAHADTLSFTLWIDGRPLIVDPGAFQYTGPMRSHFRSTAAHNTVAVDGEDQCLFWGDFRAARHPRPGPLEVSTRDDVVVASCWHDGYRRLDDPVVHHRTFVWVPGSGVVVVDRLGASTAHHILSSLHLAPGATEDGTVRAGPLNVRALGAGAQVSRRDDWYAPQLGERVAASVIEDRRTVSAGEPFGWSLLRAGTSVALERDRLTLAGESTGDLTIPLPRAPDARRL